VVGAEGGRVWVSRWCGGGGGVIGGGPKIGDAGGGGHLEGASKPNAVEPVKLQRSEVSAFWLARSSSFSNRHTNPQRGRS